MQRSNFHLAQVNIARALAPLDSAEMADFVNQIEQINAFADTSPGFVWRLQASDGYATALDGGDDDSILVTMSVWDSVESLRAFVYRGVHLGPMRRRREWFSAPGEAHLALWWVPAGEIPGIDEAAERLRHVQMHGPTPFAFTFATLFPAPDEAARENPGVCAPCPR